MPPWAMDSEANVFNIIVFLDFIYFLVFLHFTHVFTGLSADQNSGEYLVQMVILHL